MNVPYLEEGKGASALLGGKEIALVGGREVGTGVGLQISRALNEPPSTLSLPSSSAVSCQPHPRQHISSSTAPLGNVALGEQMNETCTSERANECNNGDGGVASSF